MNFIDGVVSPPNNDKKFARLLDSVEMALYEVDSNITLVQLKLLHSQTELTQPEYLSLRTRDSEKHNTLRTQHFIEWLDNRHHYGPVTRAYIRSLIEPSGQPL